MKADNSINESFEIIVIGGGHAGCEAALTSAKLGFSTALFTINLDRIAWQPCNPAVGGPAKSQLVHEVDALGGIIGKIADETAIQKRILNASRGPAVWALRAQTAGPLLEFNILFCIAVASAIFPIMPPNASTSCTN